MTRGVLSLLFLSLIIGGCASERRSSPAPAGEGAKIGSGGDAAVSAGEQDRRDRQVDEKKWPNGNVQERTEGYRDAEGKLVRDGFMTTYYESGQKKAEVSFKDGRPHGPRSTWFPSGQLSSQGQYQDGLEDGTWVNFFPTGVKQSEWRTVGGRWEGAFTQYHPNGKKRLEVEYVGGKRQGPLVVWDENGQVVGRTDFVDGIEQP